MGNRKWLGDVAIRRSNDGGRPWTEPKDGRYGHLSAAGWRGGFGRGLSRIARLE